MNKRIFILLGIVLLIVIGLIIAKKKEWIGQGGVKKVAVENPAFRTIIETVTASGKIKPESEVKISSEVSGEIIQLMVKEGDSVKKGDLLLVINPIIYQSVVAQSEAGVNQVRANRTSAQVSYNSSKALYDQALITFNRNKQLHDEKIISDAEFDLASNTLKNARTAMETSQEQLHATSFAVNSSEAQFKQANDNLNKTRIYAPASGIVSLLNVKLGERVVGTAQMAGTELIRIADLQNIMAEVEVNENDVLRVKAGDTADVEVDAYLNKKIKGVVSQIAYTSTAANSIVSTSQATNFVVKIKLIASSYADLISPEHGHRYPFRPGMSTTVDIKTQSKGNVLSVPIQSVTTREANDLLSEAEKKKSSKTEGNFDDREKKDLKEIVWVVENGKAVPKIVSTGIQDASYIEIKQGVNEKDKVVKAPFKLISKTLQLDDKVKEVEEKDLFKETPKE